MKKIIFLFPSILLLFLTNQFSVFAQTYRLDTVPGDPLKVQIYTLQNGLKVYMSVYRDEPRIQTSIAVRTGSKHDPSDNTGLSHYLEHLMFKGTQNFGTMDYEQEVVFLNKIDSLFEIYRTLTDNNERRNLYKAIDSISNLASKLAIPNEYDKMLSAIGAKGTNAYTSVEQTVYINNIPSNQFEKWLDIEFERFSKPVFRLFHTELETVYEEKNMSMDNDGRNLFEAFMNGLYPTHPYGTQTTLGNPEHLKNPSLLSLKNYYNTRYVPNNMAIILSGDFDPAVAIERINATFGTLRPVPLTRYNFQTQTPITAPIIKEVFGPDQESLRIGFRFNGFKSEHTNYLLIINSILSNSMAGLIDLNLLQSQKILNGGSSLYSKEDYTAHMFYGTPKQGQTLEEVKDLLLSQLDLIKTGNFPDWYLNAIIADFRLSEIREFESNNARNSAMVTAFVQDINWEDRINRINEMARITKQDIIEFVKLHYNDNYVVVYKRTGPRPETHKIEKPLITPVQINRNVQSAFFNDIIAREVAPATPVFLDYERDIEHLEMRNGIEILYTKNLESPTFSIFYVYDMGSNHNKKIAIAFEYLNFLGTSNLTPALLAQEFYKIGCTFYARSSEDKITLSLSGLSENMEKGIILLEKLLKDVQGNQEALANLVEDILKKRTNSKLNKNTILMGAMLNYGTYGNLSPFTNILSEQELRSLTPAELVSIIKEINSYTHHILYYGSQSTREVTDLMNRYHKTPKTLKPIPEETLFVEQPTDRNIVYVVDYDMTQVEIVMLSKSEAYNSDLLPQIGMFNEYFGSGMSSVVFQELREAKGLAYTAYANFRTPSRPDRSHYIMTFIGTQNDKLPEATSGMNNLLNVMPESENSFNTAREATLEKIRTERITKSSILFNYERARRMGHDFDIRRDMYNYAQQMSFNDLKRFQERYVKNKKFILLVLGKKESLNLEELSRYGEIKFLSLEDIFGY
ncbi:MAG: insulinase family protein [Bacteroidales bacterium]|nr:insulinase family protein [Bacteroidales bacterium]